MFSSFALLFFSRSVSRKIRNKLTESCLTQLETCSASIMFGIMFFI